jgi:hypothetical protein
VCDCPRSGRSLVCACVCSSVRSGGQRQCARPGGARRRLLLRQLVRPRRPRLRSAIGRPSDLQSCVIRLVHRGIGLHLTATTTTTTASLATTTEAATNFGPEVLSIGDATCEGPVCVPVCLCERGPQVALGASVRLPVRVFVRLFHAVGGGRHTTRSQFRSCAPLASPGRRARTSCIPRRLFLSRRCNARREEKKKLRSRNRNNS